MKKYHDMAATIQKIARGKQIVDMMCTFHFPIVENPDNSVFTRVFSSHLYIYIYVCVCVYVKKAMLQDIARGKY